MQSSSPLALHSPQVPLDSEIRDWSGSTFDWWRARVPKAEVVANSLASDNVESPTHKCLRMRVDAAIAQPPTDEMQLVLGLSGEIDLTYHNCGFGNKPHIGMAGTFACCPGNASFDARGYGDIEILVLTVPWNSIVEDVEQVSPQFSGDFCGVHRGSHVDPLVDALVKRLAWSVPANTIEADCNVSILTGRLLALANLNVSGQPGSSGLSQRVMNKILEKIHDTDRANVRLDELAALAGISKYHFIRLFSAASGQTPYQYITRLRLERARRMVQQNVDLAAIAMETGFSDQAHLSRKFKKAFGITLLKYRQLYLNQGSRGRI